MFDMQEIKYRSAVLHLLLALLFCCACRDAAAAKFNPLPDTGQALCYDTHGAEIPCPAQGQALYGQDANYQGLQSAFIVNGDGTVTDMNTGLMWQESGDDTERTHIQAINYCMEVETGGYSDWRLPTIFELGSIIDYGRMHPVLDDGIFHVSPYTYWSVTLLTPPPNNTNTTTYESQSSPRPVAMSFDTGVEILSSSTAYGYALCVRDVR